MDAFTAIALGGIVLFVVALVVIGLLHPASGADVLGWSSQRGAAERHAALEEEDRLQLLHASNARRRRRGLPERTLDDVRDDLRHGG